MGLFDTPPDLFIYTVTRDGGNPVGFQAVEADVETADTGVPELFEVLFQEHPVGGEGDIPQALYGSETFQKIVHIAPDQGLAAGDADFGYAKFGGYPHDSKNFLIPQDILMGQFGSAGKGPAIDAVQVAMVRNGYAQVAQSPVIGVNKLMPLFTA
jgi:hypothetical protein